jgi:hypothetical protein
MIPTREETAGDRAPAQASRLARIKAAWARVARVTEAWGERLVAEPWSSLAFLIVALIPFVYALATVAVRVWYESQGPYNVDAPIYWAIGHGIVKGYAPYRDLWDIKPPGIFLLSALSDLVTGGPALTHATQVLSIILVLLSPLPYLRRLEGDWRQRLQVAPTIVALWTLVAVLTAFIADNALEVQTEAHAMPGMIAYMLLIGVPGRWAFRGRAAGMMVAFGMKEPFLLVLPAVYLIMDPEMRRSWADFWGPLVLASVAGTLFLLVVGWLPAFVGLYLRSMVGSHVNVFGSPLTRTVSSFDLIWDKLRKYSLLLPIAITYCVGAYMFGATTPAAGDNRPNVAWRFQLLLIAVLLSSLAVGMSGYYYDHHHVLIVPLCLAVIFSLLSQLVRSPSAGGAAVRPLLRVGLVPLVLLVVWQPDWVPLKYFRDRLKWIGDQDVAAHKSAEVIDAVLDRLHVNRYLWLGPGGFPPYSYTRHVPLGPLFFQQVLFFDGHYPPWLTEKFRKELEQAKVIVFAQHMTGPLDNEVKATLARDFVPLPPSVIPAGKTCQYPILVRKGLPIP